MKTSKGIVASFTTRSFASLGLIPLLLAQSSLAQTKVLIDFGRDNPNGIRTLSTPGNWDSINSSDYWVIS